MLFICFPAPQYAQYTNTAYPQAVEDQATYQITLTYKMQAKGPCYGTNTASKRSGTTTQSQWIAVSLTSFPLPSNPLSPKSTSWSEWGIVSKNSKVFLWFLTKYASINEVNCSANKEAMIKQWNPVDGFETLMMQLTKGVIFAQYAGSPISDVDVIDMGIKNILSAGLYAEE